MDKPKLNMNEGLAAMALAVLGLLVWPNANGHAAPVSQVEPGLLAPNVPLWGRFEIAVTNARGYGNPFTDATLSATFTRPNQSQVRFWGFHDGDGNGGQNGHLWKLRFMPDQIGTWSYECVFSDELYLQRAKMRE